MAQFPSGASKPPSTARVYALEPLERRQIQEFLERQEGGADYRERCEEFLEEALAPSKDPSLRQGNLRVLSNPMDLTVVADMLARGDKPDLFRLQKQQYETMAADFSAVHIGKPFPLAEFSEAVFQMRLGDRRELTPEPFGELLECMCHRYA